MDISAKSLQLIVSRLIKNPGNVDTTLLVVSYTSHLLHALLTSASTSSSTLSKLSPALLNRITTFRRSLSALSGLIDDHRVFLRLLGLPGILTWAFRTLRSPPEDRTLKTVAGIQVTVNLIFQTMENIAYLASKGVVQGKSWTPTKIKTWYTWSVRCWAIHVFLEFVRLVRTRQLEVKEKEVRRQDEGKKMLDVIGGAGDDADIGNDIGTEGKDLILKDEEVKRKEAKWWRDVYVNAAWAPLTIHWSLDSGFVGEAGYASLGLIAGVLGIKEAWRVSA